MGGAMEVEGRVAVITGGASGIGRSTALAMARLGVDVVLADIHDERLAADNATSTAILSVAATTPDRIGQLVVDAVRENRFLILSDSHHQDLTAQRAQDLNAFLRMRLDGPPVA